MTALLENIQRLHSLRDSLLNSKLSETEHNELDNLINLLRPYDTIGFLLSEIDKLEKEKAAIESKTLKTLSSALRKSLTEKDFNRVYGIICRAQISSYIAELKI